MNVSQAAKIWLNYHRAHSKKNTFRAYEFTIEKFNQNFANLNLNEVSADDILDFMTKFTEGRKPQTKRVRFAHLTAFFSFLRNNFDCDFKNPCDSPMLRKLFRTGGIRRRRSMLCCSMSRRGAFGVDHPSAIVPEFSAEGEKIEDKLHP